MSLQVHIVQRGAVPPLIEMLQSKDAQLKEMSAFALGRLAQVMFSIFRVSFVLQHQNYYNCSKYKYYFFAWIYIDCKLFK